MMSKPNEKKVITALMRQQWPHVSQRPRNQDEERDTVRALSMALRFCASLLFSAQIWTTPRKMAVATWEERTRV
jgi:hypothetical protein